MIYPGDTYPLSAIVQRPGDEFYQLLKFDTTPAVTVERLGFLDMYSKIKKPDGGGFQPIHYFENGGNKFVVGFGEGNRLVLSKISIETGFPDDYYKVDWSQFIIPEYTIKEFHQPVKGTTKFKI
jgi:hypothetical protein